MMRVGYPHWHTVSTDTAGVPHGGKFGDVARFERKLNAVGLKLAWSRLRQCFGIYTQRGPHCVWQYLCESNGHPIALTDRLLWLMLYFWNHARGNTAASIKSQMEQGERDRQYRIRQEDANRRREILRDVFREFWREQRRPVRSVPKIVRAHGVPQIQVSR